MTEKKHGPELKNKKKLWKSLIFAHRGQSFTQLEKKTGMRPGTLTSTLNFYVKNGSLLKLSTANNDGTYGQYIPNWTEVSPVLRTMREEATEAGDFIGLSATASPEPIVIPYNGTSDLHLETTAAVEFLYTTEEVDEKLEVAGEKAAEAALRVLTGRNEGVLHDGGPEMPEEIQLSINIKKVPKKEDA